MAIAEPIYPFRWDITQPAQLGRLPLVKIGEPSPFELVVPDFDERLQSLCVKILAFCDDGDLYFVGRSPENIYDYLQGILFDTLWRKRLHLFHFSMYYDREQEIVKKYPDAISQFRVYMAQMGLAPWQLAKRKRPVALVDLVSSGGTMGKLVNLILNWGKESGYEARQLAAKIRIVSIVRAAYPHNVKRQRYYSCYKWQKEVGWTAFFDKHAIKSIKIEKNFWDYMADSGPRLTRSFYPARWNDDRVSRPDRTEARLKALKIALRLFNLSLTPAERRKFAGQMSRERAMRYRWFRKLLNQLN